MPKSISNPGKQVAAKNAHLGTKSAAKKMADKTVESSYATNIRPRQPKVRQSPPPRAASLEPKKRRSTFGKSTLHPSIAPTSRGVSRQIVESNLRNHHEMKARVETAQATGLLPHEWMLAVMRGEQINHFAYDAESQEIIEVIVLPTFSDRMEAAKSAMPFYGSRIPSPRPGDIGGNKDSNKRPGVMEVPLAESMEKWVEIAADSQKTLKKEVAK
jgi:hypothetical protein